MRRLVASEFVKTCDELVPSIERHWSSSDFSQTTVRDLGFILALRVFNSKGLVISGIVLVSI